MSRFTLLSLLVLLLTSCNVEDDQKQPPLNKQEALAKDPLRPDAPNDDSPESSPFNTDHVKLPT